MSDPKPSSLLSKLENKSATFHGLSLQSRLDLVNEVITCLQTQDWSSAGSWVREEVTLLGHIVNVDKGKKNGSASAAAKQIGAGKRQTFGLITMTFLKTLKTSFEYQLSLKMNGDKNVTKPDLLTKVTTYTTDEGVLNIHGPIDLTGLPGHSMELWTDPTAANSNEEDAPKMENENNNDGGVCLILGAGNQAFLTMIDVMQCLFLHPRKPVLLKHHPLRPWLMEPFAFILKPLIQRGYLDMILDGGIPQTKQILVDPKVTHVHMTGAYETAESIKEILASSRTYLSKSQVNNIVTSELGCATPWVIAPGSYTDAELKNAAVNIVTSKKTDAGCNCLSAQVVLLPEKWGLKDKFRSILKEEFQRTTTDPCYYPGSVVRCTEMANYYKKLGEGKVIEMTAALARETNSDKNQYCPDMQPLWVECGVFGKGNYDNMALTKEAFEPLLSIVELPGGDNTEEYLLKTVSPFLNDKSNIFGSLSCSIIIPNGIENIGRLQRSIVAALKYGTICINCWSVLGYAGMCQGAVWCGHGREELKQSGNGYVGNHFSIPNVEKSVIYGTPLSKAPLIDKKNPPPAIVMDALNEVFMAKTTVSAISNVFILLFIRILSCILPIEKALGWDHPYGGSL